MYPLSPSQSTTGQQTANNADTTANEQETNGEQQERSLHDSGTNITDSRQNGSNATSDISHKRNQSRSSLDKHPNHKKIKYLVKASKEICHTADKPKSQNTR